jgi:hypothetical protein
VYLKAVGWQILVKETVRSQLTIQQFLLDFSLTQEQVADYPKLGKIP